MIVCRFEGTEVVAIRGGWECERDPALADWLTTMTSFPTPAGYVADESPLWVEQATAVFGSRLEIVRVVEDPAAPAGEVY